MGKIYHRSWRRRKVLALSLGAGVATALVLPAFGHDGNVDAGAAAIDGAAPARDDGVEQKTVDWVKPPHDPDCVAGDGLTGCDRRAGKHRVARRSDRKPLRKRLAAPR
jgi:hypothetical protein